MSNGKSTSLRWERAKVLSLWVMILLLAVNFGALFGNALTPSFGTVIQPGSLIQGFGYTIFGDGTNIYARNGRSGAIDYSAAESSFSSVVQSAVTGQGVSGSIYIKKQLPTNQGLILGPNGIDSYRYDYVASSTVYMHEGFIIDSDGAMINMAGMNGAAFNVSGIWLGNYVAYNTEFRNLNFIGSLTKTNATAIYLYRTQYGPRIENVRTIGVSYSVIAEGEAYRGLIDNSYFNYGITGVTLKKGAGSFGPNEFRIQDTDISLFTAGIDQQTGAGIGVFFYHLWLEGNTIGVKTHGAYVESSFIQPGSSNTGVLALSGNVRITGNSFLLNTNAVGVNATTAYSPILVQDNGWYIDTGATGIKAMANPVFGVISGNNVFLSGAGTSAFINGTNFGSMSISSNQFSGGNPIYVNGDHNTISGNVFYSCTIAVRYNGYYNTINGNTFFGGSTDLQQVNGGNTYITGNTFSGSVYKIQILAGGVVNTSNNFGYP